MDVRSVILECSVKLPWSIIKAKEKRSKGVSIITVNNSVNHLFCRCLRSFSHHFPGDSDLLRSESTRQRFIVSIIMDSGKELSAHGKR